MVDRQPEEEGGDNRSVPERLGDFLYYTRRDDGKGFPIHVRRPVEGTLDGEQVVCAMIMAEFFYGVYCMEAEAAGRGAVCEGALAHLIDAAIGDVVSVVQ